MQGDHDDPWQLMEGLLEECESYQTRLTVYMKGIKDFTDLVADPLIARPAEADKQRRIIALTLENLQDETTRHSRYLRLVCGPGNGP